MHIQKAHFGHCENGDPVSLYTLSNSLGTSVKISDLGGIITHLYTKDAKGNIDDIVLGYDTLAPYLDNPCYFGAIIGRFTGRIRDGKVSIANDEYQLSCNTPHSQLHGGDKGFHKQLWQATTETNDTAVSLQLTHVSDDGSEGFPGKLEVTVKYRLTAQNIFTVEYSGIADKTTLVNLSQHSYFNLAGHQSLANQASQAAANKTVFPTISQHQFQLAAAHYLPMNNEGYPTGELIDVDVDTLNDDERRFDFRQERTISGNHYSEEHAFDEKSELGYDHYFTLKEPLSFHDSDTFSTLTNNTLDNSNIVNCTTNESELALAWLSRQTPAAKIIDPISKRRMRIYTNQASIVFYTGNFLDGNEQGKHNHNYQKQSGFCIEPVNCVDKNTTPENKALFEACMVKAQQPFYSVTHYVFDTLTV